MGNGSIADTDMLKKVEPLGQELDSLETQVETYKLREDYAQLIAQAQAIKTDFQNLQVKGDRSIAILKSLVIERERWEATSKTFRVQMSTIVGDVLLSAAFIAYVTLIRIHVRICSQPSAST
ncbi:unnamed protein product [Ceutorhynchus assimilis]|uniref:Dynein heavy chain coiled coil stalk domain-containing protein n=1 Tax=Ceutorhynchus assimilis TaxID=467358 RepID=A0A9N9MJZ9_9CUCU|nr:unnamed protein product [Ceutorhynchus assimilis]